MIDYDKYNDYFLNDRCDRLMVIYKDGSLTEEEVIRRHKHLKAYYFISDSQELMMTICGLRMSGIIVEEGADFKYANFRYALSRLVTEDEHILFMLNEEHKERLEDILEEMWENASNKEYLGEFMSRLEYITMVDADE